LYPISLRIDPWNGQKGRGYQMRKDDIKYDDS
jgi:hypothetical protein